jgi:hypothetical protein
LISSSYQFLPEVNLYIKKFRGFVIIVYFNII